MTTTAQLQAIKNWAVASATPFAFNTATQTVAAWWAAGADNAVLAAINSLEVGTAEAVTKSAGLVEARIVRKKIDANEYRLLDAGSRDVINFILGDPVDVSDVDVRAQIAAALANAPVSLAAVQSLYTVPATKAEEILGASASSQDISDARALP